MKDTEFDMPERMGDIFKYSNPREPFESIERISFIFSRLETFLRKVNKDIEKGGIQELRLLKNEKPDREFCESLEVNKRHVMLPHALCGLYCGMFIKIRDWGVSVITREINELLKEEEEECKS